MKVEIDLPHPMNPAVKDIISAINAAEICPKLLLLAETFGPSACAFGGAGGGSSAVSSS